MKPGKSILLIAALAVSCLSKAQDIQFSQYYAAPLFINPAFTGANVCMRINGNIRNQWPGTGKGYISEVLSLDHFDVNHSMGYGLMVVNDKAGTGNLRTLGFTGSFAYEAVINRRFAMRAGLQAGIVTRSVDMSKLIFGDQIAKGGDVPTIESVSPKVTFPDFNAGALGYGKDYWVGMSLHHLFAPEQSLLGSVASMPRKFSLHAGKKFYVNQAGDDKPEDENTWTIMPTLNYKHQARFDQLDIGCYVAKQKITFGLWYRGIPLFKAYEKGYPNNDAFVFLIGMAAEKLHIGYSYDITVSWLTARSQGAHELSISYQACKLKPKKKKAPVVSCPKF